MCSLQVVTERQGTTCTFLLHHELHIYCMALMALHCLTLFCTSQQHADSTIRAFQDGASVNEPDLLESVWQACMHSCLS